MTTPDPFTTSRLWPDANTGPFYIELHFTDDDGELVPYGITILTGPRPNEPYNPLLNKPAKREVLDAAGKPTGARETTGYILQRHRLTAEDLRGLRYGELVESVVESEAAFNQWRAEQEEERRAVLERLQGQWSSAPKPIGRPRRWGPQELAEIARAFDAGGLRGVCDWYQIKTGKPAEESTAWSWVERAREAGLVRRPKQTMKHKRRTGR